MVPRDGDVRAPNVTARERDPIGPVTPEKRASLVSQVREVRAGFEDWFADHPDIPAVGKVVLKEKALAKTHRPLKLFNEDTCPIIATRDLGELLIRLTPKGLDALEHEIATGTTKRHIHNLSTLARIARYDETDVLPTAMESKVLEEIADAAENEIRGIKIELFRYGSPEADERAVAYFFEFVQNVQCKVLREVQYTENLLVYEVHCPDVTSLAQLRSLPPVRRVSLFPRYRSFRPSVVQIDPPLLSTRDGNEPSLAPVDTLEYPVVAVVDAGIRERHPRLEQWVIERETHVPVRYRNTEHGTFVAGVLAHTHYLNDDTDGLQGCKLLDIQVLPNDDAAYGPTDYIEEPDLLLAIEEALTKYSDRVKVWNLSFSTDVPCEDYMISDFAAALDQLAKKHEVCFVIAAGNYEGRPMRPWPPTGAYANRITTPGDAFLGVTVGSIAGIDKRSSVVRKHEPSPFTRCGPGPSYIVKPDVVHVGGNLDSRGGFAEQGVKSWSESGSIVEGVGTSYSTPKIARLLAGIYSSLLPGTQSPILAKALLIHSARRPGTGGRPTDDEIHYFGYGKPGSLATILTTTSTAATMIWEAEIFPGSIFEVSDFPYPECLRKNGRWTGEVRMTLVYDPPLDRNYGFEYCRLNLDARLGVFKIKNGKRNFEGKVPLEAKWRRYEADLIKHGLKWSPVKVYHERFSQGILGDSWKLSVEPLVRSGERISGPQRFALVITISDPTGTKDVYSDVVRQLRQRFAFSDLSLTQRVRSTLGLEGF